MFISLSLADRRQPASRTALYPDEVDMLLVPLFAIFLALFVLGLVRDWRSE